MRRQRLRESSLERTGQTEEDDARENSAAHSYTWEASRMECSLETCLPQLRAAPALRSENRFLELAKGFEPLTL
jgi:hypothetical protein